MSLPAIVLVEPRIPPNAGNIIRLCANTGAMLHLIHPLGFRLDDARLRRAGLDYHEHARVVQHKSLEDFFASYCPSVVFPFSTRGTLRYDQVAYGTGDALIFGPETSGLTAAMLAAMPDAELVRIPMLPESRSMNLANSVAITLYEAWRQAEFRGGY